MHIITYYLYITFSTSTSMCRKLYNNGMHDNNKAKHIYWKIQPGAWLHLYTVKQTHCVPHTIRILHLWKEKKNLLKKKPFCGQFFLCHLACYSVCCFSCCQCCRRCIWSWAAASWQYCEFQNRFIDIQTAAATTFTLSHTA